MPAQGAAGTGQGGSTGATNGAADHGKGAAAQILGEGVRRWTAARKPAADTEDAATAAKTSSASHAVTSSTSLPDAIALYDFQPQREHQLKLSAGDLLDVLSSSAEDWWLVRPYGLSEQSGERISGWVPAAYVSTRPGWSTTTSRSTNSPGRLQRDATIKELTQRYARERKELTSHLPRREAVYSHVAQYAHADMRTAWRWVISTLLLAGGSSVLLVWLSGHWVAAQSAEDATTAGVVNGGLTLLLIGSLLLAACSRVKLFIMFHDCTHNAMFGGASDDGSFETNERVGILCGALCHTSYSSWKAGHLYHHRHSNNLTHSQVSQSAFWTTRQYAAATPRTRLMYHIQASWLTAYWFWQPCAMIFLARRISNRTENAIVAVLITTFALTAGIRGVCCELLTAGVMACIGQLLFHLQHTFEGSYKSRQGYYCSYVNAMRGCSYIPLPEILKFFTAGIEYHHIHHLNTRVPCYKLRECHESAPREFWESVPSLRAKEIWQSLTFTLMDEAVGCYVDMPWLGLKGLKEALWQSKTYEAKTS